MRDERNITAASESECETASVAFVPTWKKAAASIILFALPIVTFGFTGMMAL